MALYSERDYGIERDDDHHRSRGVQWLPLTLMAAAILAGLALLAAPKLRDVGALNAPATGSAATEQPAQQ